MRALTSAQRCIFRDIQNLITQHGGRCTRMLGWSDRTLASLERKQLITVVGDEITLHANRWRFHVGEDEVVAFKKDDLITPVQAGGTSYIFTVTGCGLHLVNCTHGVLKMRFKVSAMRHATPDEIAAAR